MSDLCSLSLVESTVVYGYHWRDLSLIPFELVLVAMMHTQHMIAAQWSWLLPLHLLYEYVCLKCFRRTNRYIYIIFIAFLGSLLNVFFGGHPLISKEIHISFDISTTNTHIYFCQSLRWFLFKIVQHFTYYINKCIYCCICVLFHSHVCLNSLLHTHIMPVFVVIIIDNRSCDKLIFWLDPSFVVYK